MRYYSILNPIIVDVVELKCNIFLFSRLIHQENKYLNIYDILNSLKTMQSINYKLITKSITAYILNFSRYLYLYYTYTFLVVDLINKSTINKIKYLY